MVGIPCPHCSECEPVILNGFNRGGSQKYRCKACVKKFTPQPNSRIMTPETEETIISLLAERISQRGIARSLKVSRETVRKVRKKKAASIESEVDASGGLARVAAPEDDVIEFDEICVRKSPGIWLTFMLA